MSIYKKLARIQRKLMGVEIPKSGRNKFQKYNYYELEDLLPPIFEACFEERLTLMFNFTEDAAVLHLKSWDANTEVSALDEIRVRAPFPELAPNKGMSNIQAEGAYITYLKRYLLINLFLIMENDIVDSNKCGCDCNDKPTAKKTAAKGKAKKTKPKTPVKKDTSGVDIPKAIRNAANLCKTHNLVLTKEGLVEQIEGLKEKGLISDDERKDLSAFAKKHGDYILGQLA